MTAQFHENLILEGQQTTMAYCPPVPLDHPHILILADADIHKGMDAGKISRFVFSTACWRGYIGTWELKDGGFYLNDLAGRYAIRGSEPIFAEWVSAVLRIPDGELLHYVHMGFGSVYEFETHIKLENGLVMEERRIDNRNKNVNTSELGWRNLPGSENEFDGDEL